MFSDIGGTLAHKYGPLPGYAWVGIGAGVIVLGSRLLGGGPAAAAATGDGTAAKPSFLTLPPDQLGAGGSGGGGNGTSTGGGPLGVDPGYGPPIIDTGPNLAQQFATSSDPNAGYSDGSGAAIAPQIQMAAASPVYESPMTSQTSSQTYAAPTSSPSVPAESTPYWNSYTDASSGGGYGGTPTPKIGQTGIPLTVSGTLDPWLVEVAQDGQGGVFDLPQGESFAGDYTPPATAPDPTYYYGGGSLLVDTNPTTGQAYGDA